MATREEIIKGERLDWLSKKRPTDAARVQEIERLKIEQQQREERARQERERASERQGQGSR
jgi:hypothetical protein